MCGICGFTGQPDEQTIKKMTNLIYHRGPDEDGFYSDQQVSLAMRRLSIVDIYSGHQPVHNEDKTIWVVFNGEIYNFEYLRDSLGKKGHRFYTDHSDTEVLVHLYEDYGLDFVKELNGMFAIALWDIKKETLILVRDRMGVKPLFYASTGGNLVFGSEIKSILAYPDYKKEVSYAGIYHYFSFKNVPSPLTAFDGIFSLMPGEMLTYSKGDIKKTRYWQIDFSKPNNLSAAQIKDRVFSILEDAVKIRMNCDVPFGAYLSGGVDSSAVVAMMSRFMDQPIKTFTLGYEDDFQNKAADLHFAREVSKAFNTEHHEYIMSFREVPDQIDKVIEAFDQPFSGTISTFFLSKLIRDNVTVALSGDGADELFGSYLTHRLAQPMDYFAKVYDKYRLGQLDENDKLLLKPFEDNLEFLESLFVQSQGDPIRWRSQLLTFTEKEKSHILSDEFLAHVGNESSQDYISSYFDYGTAEDPLNRILEVDWHSLLPDQVLAFVDFLSMAHSVEVRSPFLDYRLVEFVATIPGHLKIKNGNVKDILKESVEAILPEGVTKRPKEGFVLPIFNWLRGPLRAYVGEILSEEKVNQHGFLKYNVVSDLVDEFMNGNIGLAAKVWNIMMFQVWWNRYFR